VVAVMPIEAEPVKPVRRRKRQRVSNGSHSCSSSPSFRSLVRAASRERNPFDVARWPAECFDVGKGRLLKEGSETVDIGRIIDRSARRRA
jgi:hypothetical protein